jgi:hypothetical protein
MADLKNFINCLDKWGVRYVIKYVSYTPYPNRNNQKLTGIIAHTEGVPNNIAGTADRSLFAYFNSMMSKPETQRACSHAYIAFSGLFEVYIDAIHGCWAVAIPAINVSKYHIETQDNGRFNTPSTYTEAQYDTWRRVFCALKDFAQTYYGTNIPFNLNPDGLIGHNHFAPGRACPGRLDLERIIHEARELWESIMNPQPDQVEYLVTYFDAQDVHLEDKILSDLTSANAEYERFVSLLKGGQGASISKHNITKATLQLIDQQIKELDPIVVEPIEEPKPINKFNLFIFLYELVIKLFTRRS